MGLILAAFGGVLAQHKQTGPVSAGGPPQGYNPRGACASNHVLRSQRRNLPVLDQQIDQDDRCFLRRVLAGVDGDFGVFGGLVRVVDAGETLRFAGAAYAQKRTRQRFRRRVRNDVRASVRRTDTRCATARRSRTRYLPVGCMNALPLPYGEYSFNSGSSIRSMRDLHATRWAWEAKSALPDSIALPRSSPSDLSE